MTVLLATARRELTSLVLLAPRSDHLSYGALLEESEKGSQLIDGKDEKYRIRFYMRNRVENISFILKTRLTDRKDKSRTKLTSTSYYFLRKQCIGLIMVLSY